MFVPISYFPSDFEATLWHIGSLCIVEGGGVGLWVLIEASVRLDGEETGRWERILAWTFGAVGPLIAVSRLYLVVESFISVRSLPSGAYVTIEWVDLIPHIG